MSVTEPRRPTPSEREHELAMTLAERRSAATAYVNVKVSAQGAMQPDVNITPDTSPEDAERMTTIALESVARIMAAGNGVKITPAVAAKRKETKPEPSDEVLF